MTRYMFTYRIVLYNHREVWHGRKFGNIKLIVDLFSGNENQVSLMDANQKIHGGKDRVFYEKEIAIH